MQLSRTRRGAIFLVSLHSVLIHSLLGLFQFDHRKLIEGAGRLITNKISDDVVGGGKDHNNVSDNTTTYNSESIFAQNNHHAFATEMLDIMEWERDCIVEAPLLVRPYDTNRSKKSRDEMQCHPPEHMMSECCDGTFSSGQTVLDYGYRRCRAQLTSSVHNWNSTLQQSVREYFSYNPINDILVSTEGQVMACDVCHVVEMCRRKNLTITLVGDSVQAQIWQGLIYELQRRKYTIALKNNATQRPGFLKTIVLYRETLSVRSSLWNDTVHFQFFQMYKLPFAYREEMEEVVMSADILVFGFGLHWNSVELKHPASLPEDYASSLTDLLVYMKQNNNTRTKLLVHREAAAQHFDAPAGDFGLWKKKLNKSTECKPVTYDANHTNWRERCVQEAASKAGYSYTVVGRDMPPIQSSLNRHPELVVLPYYNFTAALYDQHPLRKHGDCTHYCPSPFLYSPIWRSLRIAMDRQFEINDNISNME